MTVPSTERLGDHELEWIRENAAELNQGSYGPQAAQAAEALLRVLNELDRRKAAFTEELRDLLRKHDAKVDGLERVLESTRERRDDYSRKLIGWREAAEKAAAERDALQGQLDKAREAQAVIAEMHEKTLYFPSGNREPGPEMCLHCNEVWPCDTMRALGLGGEATDGE